MFRRLLLTAALILTGVSVSAAPAQAIPVGGGGTSQLVTLYFDDAAHTHFIGESWTGCPTNPAGSWGTSSRYVYRYTLEC
ncbi:DUF6289 family protein [Longispora sp. NPDC051575]|uniref:DUF6289 family protein n=1 Tax=Longispora sp. NPDC051575 TaxID=3154943 RepID=UPI00343A1E3B